MDDIPETPRNVRVIIDEGVVLHLEMQYFGVIDGKYIWESTTAIPFRPVGTRIECDFLPANTSIHIPTVKGE